MGIISEHIKDIKTELPVGVDLVAVSKFHPADAIREAYDAGQRIFGESRIQELLPKKEQLPEDIAWHFIGHLQTNKVKFIAPFISLIHSGDSEKLIKEIDRCAVNCGRIIRCLLQLHVAEEATKSGFTEAELNEYISSGRWHTLANIRFCGVMGMASLTENKVQINREFETIRSVFDKLKHDYFASSPDFSVCSMGMSHDYHQAISCRTTMIRIGTDIFGERI
ncbi:MAG: YggS family pyridoxal phosphate-dependent enzyme [Bacteroidales bacterium]